MKRGVNTNHNEEESSLLQNVTVKLIVTLLSPFCNN